MHNYRELKIWQRSIVIAEQVYKITAGFPKEEIYGLSSQMRRCAVSISSNISEGAGRNSSSQFKYFLEVAMGSCNELQTQLELAGRLGFVNMPSSLEMQNEVLQIYKMILGFYNIQNTIV